MKFHNSLEPSIANSSFHGIVNHQSNAAAHPPEAPCPQAQNAMPNMCLPHERPSSLPSSAPQSFPTQSASVPSASSRNLAPDCGKIPPPMPSGPVHDWWMQSHNNELRNLERMKLRIQTDGIVAPGSQVHPKPKVKPSRAKTRMGPQVVDTSPSVYSPSGTSPNSEAPTRNFRNSTLRPVDAQKTLPAQGPGDSEVETHLQEAPPHSNRQRTYRKGMTFHYRPAIANNELAVTAPPTALNDLNDDSGSPRRDVQGEDSGRRVSATNHRSSTRLAAMGLDFNGDRRPSLQRSNETYSHARKTSKEIGAPLRRLSKEGRRSTSKESRVVNEPSGRSGRRASTFEQSVQIAKAHAIPLDEVQRAHAEFTTIDTDCDGQLKKDEFIGVLRRRLGLGPTEAVPAAHVKRAWVVADLNNDGMIDFEEFVLWDHSNAFSEELNLDSMDRRLREVSRKHGLQLDVVEEVKRVFDRYDCDNSGGIDREEFKKLLATLLGCKDAFDVPQERLERYWREADPRQTGTIDLEGFVLFYTREFPGSVGGRGGMSQYSSFGKSRFAR